MLPSLKARIIDVAAARVQLKDVDPDRATFLLIRRRPRAWYRNLDRELVAEEEEEEEEEEETFLAEKVYRGASRHERVRIDYSNRFSDRV